MKKLLLVVVTAFSAIVGSAQFSKATLQATGLTCAMCSNAINKALQGIPFVESVKSDIKNSSFDIVFKQGTAISIDALKDAVEDAGFSVGGLKVTGTFSDVKIEKDKHVKIGNDNFHFLNADNRVLNGEQTITVVDRNFVTEKQFKKYAASTKMECIKTGKTGSCCEKDGITAGERIYHVTI
ncbi:MAG: heavy-metal-associated domain-containing protein [Chitinophagaceae bacterium]|nr:heavy-metal-associated domain-containing protein [Chitinophagaceae bacterium]